MIKVKPWWQRTQISSQIVHVNTIFTVAVEKSEQIPKQVVYIVHYGMSRRSFPTWDMLPVLGEVYGMWNSEWLNERKEGEGKRLYWENLQTVQIT